MNSPRMESAAARSGSDRELLLRAQAGNAEAFRVIFDRGAPGVRRFLGELLRDDAAADEGTRVTVGRAPLRLTALEQPEEHHGWVFGVARLVFLVPLRRK